MFVAEGGVDESSMGRQVRTFVGLFALLAALLFGGMAVGLAIAVYVAGASIGVLLVGFLVLPLCLGLGLSAWRGIAMAWLTGRLVRALVRSRADEARFREATQETVWSMAASGPPGTWVFVPVATLVSALGAFLMALLAERDGSVAGILLFAAGVGYGFLLRRLARRSLLPIPEE